VRALGKRTIVFAIIWIASQAQLLGPTIASYGGAEKLRMLQKGFIEIERCYNTPTEQGASSDSRYTKLLPKVNCHRIKEYRREGPQLRVDDTVHGLTYISLINGDIGMLYPGSEEARRVFKENHWESARPIVPKRVQAFREGEKLSVENFLLSSEHWDVAVGPERTTIDGKTAEAFVVSFGESKVEYFFDPETHYCIERINAVGSSLAERVEFSDYGHVDGLVYPFHDEVYSSDKLLYKEDVKAFGLGKSLSDDVFVAPV